jgi:hypothetical protein
VTFKDWHRNLRDAGELDIDNDKNTVSIGESNFRPDAQLPLDFACRELSLRGSVFDLLGNVTR